MGDAVAAGGVCVCTRQQGTVASWFWGAGHLLGGLANVWVGVAHADGCSLPEHLSLSLESIPSDPEMRRHKCYL